MPTKELIKYRAEQFCKDYEQSKIPLTPIPKFIIDACAEFAIEILNEYMETNNLQIEGNTKFE